MKLPDSVILRILQLPPGSRLLLDQSAYSRETPPTNAYDLRKTLQRLKLPYAEVEDAEQPHCVAFWTLDTSARLTLPPYPPQESDPEYRAYKKSAAYLASVTKAASKLDPLTGNPLELDSNLWLIDPASPIPEHPAAARLHQADGPTPATVLDVRSLQPDDALAQVALAIGPLRQGQGVRLLVDGVGTQAPFLLGQIDSSKYFARPSVDATDWRVDVWRTASRPRRASAAGIHSEVTILRELTDLLRGDGRSVLLPDAAGLSVRSLRQHLLRAGAASVAVRRSEPNAYRVWAFGFGQSLPMDVLCTRWQDLLLTVEEGVPLPKRRNTGAPRGVATRDPDKPMPPLPTMQVGEVIEYGADSSGAKSIAARLRFQGYRMRAALNQDGQWYVKRLA